MLAALRCRGLQKQAPFEQNFDVTLVCDSALRGQLYESLRVFGP